MPRCIRYSLNMDIFIFLIKTKVIFNNPKSFIFKDAFWYINVLMYISTAALWVKLVAWDVFFPFKYFVKLIHCNTLIRMNCSHVFWQNKCATTLLKKHNMSCLVQRQYKANLIYIVFRITILCKMENFTMFFILVYEWS